MKRKMSYMLVIVPVMFSLACSLVSGLLGGPASGPNSNPTQLQATGNGPSNLTARAVSADSVMLNWQKVDGATYYRISVGIADKSVTPVIDLDSSVTSYTDFMAMPGSPLTYAVEAWSGSGSIGQSVVNVTTPERKPNPLSADVELDGKKTASATIGPEGGSLSLKDAQGAEYKLEIPAGALSVATPITLTALKSIGSWPLDGGQMLGAVKIEPDGLLLNDVATLTITLPKAASKAGLSNLGFAFSGAGQELHLVPRVTSPGKTSFVPHLADSAASQILQFFLSQFNGTGVGTGSAKGAGDMADNHAPNDEAAALDQKRAAAQALDDDLAPLTQTPLSADPFATGMRVWAHDLSAQIYNAQDCKAMKSGVVSFQKWLRTTQGFSDQAVGQAAKDIWSELKSKTKELLDKADADCQKAKQAQGGKAPADLGCLQWVMNNLTAPSTSFWRDFAGQMAGEYGGKNLGQIADRLDECKPTSYKASGTLVGDICSLDQPFVLTSAFPQLELTLQFQPTSAFGGTVDLTGGDHKCTFDSQGSYIVNLAQDGSGTIIPSFPLGNVSCPEGGTASSFPEHLIVLLAPLPEQPAACSAP